MLMVNALHASFVLLPKCVFFIALKKSLLAQFGATQTWNALLITTVMNLISAFRVRQLKLFRVIDARPTLIALLIIIAMSSIFVSQEPQDKVI